MNIQKYTSENIFDVLREFLYRVDGKSTGMYMGEVINNRDPKKKGRCRIRVAGVYDDVSDTDIPWAIPNWEYVDSDKTKVHIPVVGSKVSVYFENGDYYKPHYSNTVPTNEVSSTAKSDYPNTLVIYEDNNGNKITINRQRQQFILEHSSGTKLEIDRLGSVSVESSSGSEFKMDNVGNVDIDAKLNVNINAVNIKTDHSLFMQDSGSAVIPSGMGPYCAIPVCPVTGSPHVGQIVSP